YGGEREPGEGKFRREVSVVSNRRQRSVAFERGLQNADYRVSQRRAGAADGRGECAGRYGKRSPGRMDERNAGRDREHSTAAGREYYRGGGRCTEADAATGSDAARVGAR